jgi:hemolysin D
MSILSDRFPTLTQHIAVLKDSWRRQNVAERSPVERSDHEFLPAALEIMEKPPSPGLRALLLTLCGLFVLGIAWSLIGRVDVVAVASGKTIAAGNAKVIQPIQIGNVRAIHVRDGDFVKAGQLLIELDPTMAIAGAAQSDQSLLSAKTIKARNDALLAYLAGRPATFAAPPNASAGVVMTQKRLVRTAIASYEAERASLIQQRAERAAERDSANFELAKLRETLPYLDKQMEARRKLTENGHFSKLKLLEYEQARVEHIRNMDVQRSAAARATAAMRDIDAQLRRLRETFERAAATEMADASDKASTAEQEVLKAQKVQELMQLRAPVDGVVQQLAVNTIGGVVQPAQPLMVIVPCRGGRLREECRSSIEVEAYVLNRDVGFIRQGQRVAVKLETFNFTDYGFIEGQVRSVSHDTVDVGNRNASGDGVPGSKGQPNNPVYVARIDLKCGAPANAALCNRVSPGMAVQAEIRTGTRRIIDYLLSPLAKTMSEAGRER